MQRRTLKQAVVILGFLAALVYGTSYQQFRHFDPTDPRGANDSASYLRMSHGDFDVNPVHRYRFVVPTTARALRAVMPGADSSERDKLSFYVVNFLSTIAAAWVLLLLLEHLGFATASCLLGAAMFIASRITILSTGTPLVDAPYFAACVLVVYLALANRFWTLIAVLPALILVKETMLAIALLPLLLRGFRRLPYLASFALGGALLYLSRWYINGLVPSAAMPATAPPTLVDIVLTQLAGVLSVARSVLTPGGLHDLQNAYSFFLLFAVLGYFANRRTKWMANHSILLAHIPLAIFFALISGNPGRMLFHTFPVVIPYALVFLEDALGFGRGDYSSPSANA